MVDHSTAPGYSPRVQQSLTLVLPPQSACCLYSQREVSRAQNPWTLQYPRYCESSYVHAERKM